jgi:rSAM/selenodomain-associated transferase 2
LKKISVIIPVLNEENSLGRTLSHLSPGEFEELIIVDGKSEDKTVTIAKDFTDKVFVTDRGRGRQMNEGAKRAGGDILLFLHADTLLPKDAFSMIRSVLEDERVSAGTFFLGIDHPSITFRFIEWGANLRSSFTRIPYGDQGLFLRKEVFEGIGGFAEIPLMEDIEIAKRLKKGGEIIFVKEPVLTSPRRWLKEGAVYTTLRDWTTALAFGVFHVSPEKLIRYYRDVR